MKDSHFQHPKPSRKYSFGGLYHGLYTLKQGSGNQRKVLKSKLYSRIYIAKQLEITHQWCRICLNINLQPYESGKRVYRHNRYPIVMYFTIDLVKFAEISKMALLASKIGGSGYPKNVSHQKRCGIDCKSPILNSCKI